MAIDFIGHSLLSLCTRHDCQGISRELAAGNDRSSFRSVPLSSSPRPKRLPLLLKSAPVDTHVWMASDTHFRPFSPPRTVVVSIVHWRCAATWTSILEFRIGTRVFSSRRTLEPEWNLPQSISLAPRGSLSAAATFGYPDEGRMCNELLV